MPAWNTPLSICIFRIAICMPPPAHWINWRFSSGTNRRRSINLGDPATLGGGRYHPHRWQSLSRALSSVVDLAADQGAPSHRPLPHGCLGRPSRLLYPLRISHRHLLQLLSESALSEMPDQRSPEVARPAPTGVAAGELFSSRLQRAAFASPKQVNTLLDKTEPIQGLCLGHNLHIKGTIVLAIVVDANGEVTCATVVSGHPLIIGTAIDSVRRWKFRPYAANGVKKSFCGKVTCAMKPLIAQRNTR
jgi:hypothetical protein